MTENRDLRIQNLQGRLLFTTTILSTADGFLSEIAELARHRGFKLELATNCSMTSELERPYERITNVPWGRGFRSPFSTARSFFRLRALISSQRFDVVHVHTPTASAITRLAVGSLKPARRPTVFYTAHGLHFGRGLTGPSHLIARLIEKFLLRWTNTLIVINDEDEKWARAATTLGTNVIRNNGVGIRDRIYDADTSPTAKKNAREFLGLASDDFVAVCIGELNPNKRHEMAINAMRMLKGNRTLLIVGKGSEYHKLERLGDLANSSDPECRIRMEGYQIDVLPYLLAADCLIHSSRREGHPLVIIEAMALSTPTVAFAIRGCIDSMKDGRGLLAKEQDCESLAHVIQKAKEGGLEIEQMVDRAKNYSKSFRRSELASDLVDLYEAVVESEGVRGLGDA